MKIDGYTAAEWNNRDELELVITDTETGEEVRFVNHVEYGKPEWPPLDANGDDWYIEKPTQDDNTE